MPVGITRKKSGGSRVPPGAGRRVGAGYRTREGGAVGKIRSPRQVATVDLLGHKKRAVLTLIRSFDEYAARKHADLKRLESVGEHVSDMRAFSVSPRQSAA